MLVAAACAAIAGCQAPKLSKTYCESASEPSTKDCLAVTFAPVAADRTAIGTVFFKSAKPGDPTNVIRPAGRGKYTVLRDGKDVGSIVQQEDDWITIAIATAPGYSGRMRATDHVPSPLE